LTPILSGYLFLPATRNVVVSGNVTGQDFLRRDLGEPNSFVYLPVLQR
jgi:hypothetical protein